MQGDLADTTALELCLQLAAQGATATVAVSSPRGTGVLVLVGGRLAGARAPTRDPVPGARLGERLVASGRLARADLDAVVATQSTEPSAPALGHLLVERGLVPADVVRVALQEQLLDAIEEMAGWFEGRWDVQPATAVDADVAVLLPVERVVTELRRRTAERVRATDRRLALQGPDDPADTDSTAVHTEDPELSASPTTGSRPVAFADDGWADRRHDAATTVEEPEPWVGWAKGAPRRAQQEPDDAPAAPAPAASSWEPATAPTPAAPATSRPPVDHDVRRALFSELHEVGRSNPTVAAPAASPAADTPEAPAPPAAASGTPQPAASAEATGAPGPLSRADVSDLLAELHALNLDD